MLINSKIYCPISCLRILTSLIYSVFLASSFSFNFKYADSSNKSLYLPSWMIRLSVGTSISFIWLLRPNFLYANICLQTIGMLIIASKSSVFIPLLGCKTNKPLSIAIGVSPDRNNAVATPFLVG